MGVRWDDAFALRALAQQTLAACFRDQAASAASINTDAAARA